MGKKITDELLYKYCKTVDEYITDKIPDDEEIDHTYSEEFENQIKKIIKQEKKRNLITKFYNYPKKVAIIFLIIISVFGATMSVDAIRYRVIEAIKHVYEKFTMYEFRESINGEFEPKFPSYLPRDFKRIDYTEMTDFVSTDYSNGYDYVSYECFKINNDNLYVDTENTKVSKVVISGNIKAEYIEKGDRHTLLWQDDKNCYILDIESEENINTKIRNKYDELIKIAESIK